LILLLPISFTLIFLIHLLDSRLDARLAVLRTSVLWGVLVVALTEGLSLVGALQLVPLTLAWAAIDAALLVWLLRKIRRGAGLHLPPMALPASRADRILLGGLGLIILLTGVVALAAPVQNWDSLSYHMARVAEWAHRGSVSIYPTGIERQNYMSPGAEFLVLQTYLLGQGDRWANLTNWFALIGCVLGGVPLVYADDGIRLYLQSED
jgi:hypothetical protein